MSGLLPSRVWIALGVGVALLALVAIVASRGERRTSNLPPLSGYSTEDDGAKALALWLDELGYRVEPFQYRRFELTSDMDAFFTLAPTREIAEAEAAEIRRYVEGGGTLLIASDEWNSVFDTFGLDFSYNASAIHATALQPVFQALPLEQALVDTDAALWPDAPEWTPILGNDDAIFAAEATFGRGRVVALAALYPLSNEGIGQADNAALALHAVAGLPRGSTVVFNEYHHGLTEHGTLTQQIRSEPWGWAILYASFILFAYLALSGRRFGRAIPPVWQGARRSSGEYVATMGNMLRRGKHSAWLRDHYLAQVKRTLGSRYGVRANQPAREFVAELALHRPDAAALAEPLERLERSPNPDDSTVVNAMRDIDRIERQLR
jgi:hypothetical protein